MKEKTEKTGNGTKQVKALDDMEKQVAKAERAAKTEANKAKRLEKATERLEVLKQGAKENTIGFANVTLKRTHQERALNSSVQGAIDSLNLLIKEVAKAANLDKQTIAALKGESAKTLLQQVTNDTLPLYIDNKGLYKVETLYRLVASKAKNTELRTLLNNLNKATK
jgi:hypothetical protein